MNTTTEKKIITLRDAGQRLQWRFRQGKAFQPNQNDADALSMLLRTINQNQQKAVQENLLFAKLYVATMTDFATYFKNTDIAHKEISRILSTDIRLLCLKLTERLNDLERDKYIKECVGKPDPQMFLSVTETWDLDSVIGMVNASVTQSLNNFKNLP